MSQQKGPVGPAKLSTTIPNPGRDLSPINQSNLPFLGLNIIVLNEEKVIKRLLDTVAPILDWYTIIDTGSTDRTKEIVKEVMDGHGISGEIIDHKWVNFCTARNFAMESIKGKAQYGFWIDADEQLLYESNFNKDNIQRNLVNFDCGSIMVEYGQQNYFRTQFFKVDFPWIWKGAVHEIMLQKPGFPNPKGCQVQGLHTLVTADGSSWGDRSRESQRKKYKEHAELLHEYIKTDSDVRWLFYLAQSYRDCFEWANSEKWYAERIKAGGGYWEELYFSQLMVASMKVNQKKPIPEVLEAYAQCSKYDINRCEHLIPLTRHHQACGNWPMAYMISKYCYDNHKKNPFPKSSLFIEKNIYNWIILDLHCIAAYYMKKYGEARQCYNKLRKAINKGIVPESEHDRITANEKWYTKKHEQEMVKKLTPPQPMTI